MIPKSVKYLLSVDLFERYSFYALRSIMIVFFIDAFRISNQDASFLTHTFLALCYLSPILGGYLIDQHFTKYKYGLFAILAYSVSFFSMYFGGSLANYIASLLLIALFSGLLKPLIISFITDNTKNLDKKSQEDSFNFYYLFINLGSIFAFIFHPVIYKKYGYKISFLIPSITMLVALASFVFGKQTYKIQKPCKGMNIVSFLVIFFKFKFLNKKYKKLGVYLKNKHNQEYLKLFGEILRCFKALGLIAFYFSLYEIQFSAFVIQGLRMKQSFLSIPILANQIGTINPIVVMISIPFLAKFVYNRFNISLKNRILLGFGLTFVSLFLVGVIEILMHVFGNNMTVALQVPSYLFMAIGEVMVYGSALQLFFGKSSDNIKSTVGSLFFFAIFVGNMLDAWFFKIFTPSIDAYLFFECSAFMLVVLYMFKRLKIKE